MADLILLIYTKILYYYTHNHTIIMADNVPSVINWFDEVEIKITPELIKKLTIDDDNMPKFEFFDTDHPNIKIQIINDWNDNRFGVYVLFVNNDNTDINTNDGKSQAEKLSKQAETDKAYIHVEVSAFVMSPTDPAESGQKTIFNEIHRYKHGAMLDFGYPFCFLPKDLKVMNRNTPTFENYVEGSISNATATIRLYSLIDESHLFN